MSESFTCPRCGATSWNPVDAQEGYCGRCHDWTGDARKNAEWRTAMSEARHILERYLGRIGMSQPKDAAQQFAVTLLRQWVDHLDDVLEAENLTGDVRIRIVRAMIYGGAPTLAEAEVRDQLATEMVSLAQHTTRPRYP